MTTSPSHRARGVLAGFANSADVGGLALPSGEPVPHKRIIRANTPTQLSQTEFDAALAFEFSAVLDLRSEEEVQAVAHPLNQLAGYRSLPLIDPAAEAREDFHRFTSLGEIYSSSLQRNAAHIAPIFSALADAPPGPVLISCRAGRDRTGMIVALLLDLVGVDREAIAEDYALVNETPNTSAGESGHRRNGGVDILAMLDHVTAAYGSTDAYLRWLDLTDPSVAAVKERLLP
ncbi:tyrosine-protein phosphatase [Kineococcus sp. NBC_00420]|uniref:tyrosine-protein phosphatase n=1 Tax=Kineococcus sp. NBC_00420 TaxID=2903564 RepID=UPI002E201B4E